MSATAAVQADVNEGTRGEKGFSAALTVYQKCLRAHGLLPHVDELTDAISLPTAKFAYKLDTPSDPPL